VSVSDGNGKWRRTRVTAPPRIVSNWNPTARLRWESAPQYRIGVGFALLKGDRSELALQKLVELGVDDCVPLICDNGVRNTLSESSAKRFERVAREAAMQSRRVFLRQFRLP